VGGDLPARLLWSILPVGAGGSGRVTSEATAGAFDASSAAQVEDLRAGLLWWLLVVGADCAAAIELDGSGGATIGDFPAGLLRLMVVGAGGGRSMPPLKGGN
jgi:hypothetical protein